MLVVTLPSMVIHLKQNYISHLPPGLHDGWQGLQPKHPGLIAPLFSVTNVTRKTYDTSRFPAVLNENMFVIGKGDKKYMGLCHTKNCKRHNSSIFFFLLFLLPIGFSLCVVLPVPESSVQLSHFDWFISAREWVRAREKGWRREHKFHESSTCSISACHHMMYTKCTCGRTINLYNCKHCLFVFYNLRVHTVDHFLSAEMGRNGVLLLCCCKWVFVQVPESRLLSLQTSNQSEPN